MYTYDDYDYEEEVINESALDMAMDMSDRYGIAVEDAYDFAVDALEGSLKDPHKRVLREVGRAVASRDAENQNNERRTNFIADNIDSLSKFRKAESYYDRTRRPGHYSVDNNIKQHRLQSFKKGLNDPDYRGGYGRVPGKPINRGVTISGMDKFSPEYYYNGRNSDTNYKYYKK